MESSLKEKRPWTSIIPVPYELKDNMLEVSYPGFFSDDLNGKRIFLPERLAKIMESSRFLTTRLLPGFQHLSSKDKTLMVLSIDYNIRPEFYALTALSRLIPYKIVSWVSSVGRSSFVLTQVLFREDRSQPLVMVKGIYVQVDWKTRRPHPLPLQMKNSVPIQDTDGNRMKLPEIPAEKYCFEAEIQPSDMDSNLHTNQAVYVRLCSDAAASAEACSYYRGIHDVPSRPLFEMWNFYNGESMEGDKLTIYTWQNPGERDIIYFVIKKQATPIFYSRWKLGQMPMKASI